MKILQILAFLVVVYLLTIIITVASFATTIDRVVDGDTFIIKKPTPPADLMQTSHRLAGIDTPEKASKCKKASDLAYKAKEFVSNFIKGGVEIVYIELDKYGRYLVNVDKNGLNLADELVKNGLAVYYDGGAKTKDWCK